MPNIEKTKTKLEWALRVSINFLQKEFKENLDSQSTIPC